MNTFTKCLKNHKPLNFIIFLDGVSHNYMNVDIDGAMHCTLLQGETSLVFKFK